MKSFQVLNDLAHVPDHFHVSILMRHSNRFPIVDPDTVYEIGLTPEGFVRAEEFGIELARFKRRAGRLMATPVNRCIDTADSIAAGAGWHQKALPHEAISYPFIERAYLQIEDHFYHPNGLPIEIKKSVGFLLENAARPAGLDLFVTHDSVIACMLGYLINEKIEESNWVEFLEGFLVWQEGKNVYLRWRDRQYKIDAASLH